MRSHGPLYFTKGASGEEFWAWNRDHLKLLIAVLSGGDGLDGPYAWLATYIPGRWKARAKHYEKLARGLLEK